MLHVVDPNKEEQGDRLRKVSSFVDHFQNRCRDLYQPLSKVAIDERMVKSKHRSGIRQYIKNKPTKFGIKLWVLADSSNGYTYNFNVYTGKDGNATKSGNGLGYDIVMKLSLPLLGQGYQIFFDNFYTSIPLVTDLFKNQTPSCGTVSEKPKGLSARTEKWKIVGIESKTW